MTSRFQRLGLLAVIVSSLFALPAATQAPVPPDLVAVVVIDTLRADHLPIYGYRRDTTPQLSQLWTSAVVFDQSYAASAATQPSVASLLTGRRPLVHGFWNLTQPRILQPNVAWWAQVHGYHAIGVNANPNTAQYNGSFDSWWAEQPPDSFYPAARVIAQARAALKARPKDSKVFLYLQLADPHTPYNPPVYEKSFFAGDKIGSKYPPRFSGLTFQNSDDVTPPILRNMVNRYDAAIHYMDSQLAPFLSELKKSFPNHFIMFTADHGEAFFERGAVGHARAMYNTVIRVPMIVMDSALPNREQQRTSVLVSGMDVFTTVADRVTGYPATVPTDGVSFLCALTSRCEAVPRTILSEMPYPNDDGRGESGCWGVAHIFQPKWGSAQRTISRLTTVGDSACGRLKKSIIHRNQWFDVSVDHLQTTQLRPRAARAADLGPLMDTRWPPPKSTVTATRKLTEEEIRRLRALGYVQ